MKTSTNSTSFVSETGSATKMSHSSDSSAKTSSQIEVMQNLFEEILQIQKENKQADESMIRIQEIIQESSKVVENSTSPNEIIIDAKILQTGTNYVSSNVSSLNTNLTSFSESKYVNGLLNFMENANQVVPIGKEWECFGCVTYKMFKKSHPVTFMLGTFTLEPPPEREKAKIERKHFKKGPESEKKVLSKVTEKENPMEAGSDVYDHILKSLVRQYKKNDKKPVNYFRFIIDPVDYWRTIENIFHFAFLVRDGSAKIFIEKGLPVIEPVLKNPEERVGRKTCNNQFCLRLSVQEWKECIDRFKVTSPSIPPFVKKS